MNTFVKNMKLVQNQLGILNKHRMALIGDKSKN